MDGKRCDWCGTDPLYVTYHDTEWGVPDYDDRALYEKLMLDGFQAGLSWITILRKRDAFRAAFDGFDPQVVARYGEADVARLLGVRRFHVGFRGWRASAERPAQHGRRTRPDRSLAGAIEGIEEKGLQILRPDHRLCGDAGLRAGQRSHGGLPPARGGARYSALGTPLPRHNTGTGGRRGQ